MTDADKLTVLEDMTFVARDLYASLAAHKATIQRGVAAKKADEALWTKLEDYGWVMEEEYA